MISLFQEILQMSDRVDTPNISRNWAPIRPLKPIQRIGYLKNVVSLRCIRTIPGFKTGRFYNIETGAVTCYRWGEKTSIEGEQESVEWSSVEMTVKVTDSVGIKRIFMDDQVIHHDWHYSDQSIPEFGFSVLMSCFDIPNVPCVVELFQELYDKNIAKIKDLECLIQYEHPEFKFKEYQVEDLASGAIRDGFMLCWDTGLGKSLGAYTLPLIKFGWEYTSVGVCPTKPILIVCISDLTSQTMKEGKKWFGISTVHIRNSAILRDYIRNGVVKNGFYCISYNELTNDESIVELCKDLFSAVIVDEGTKFKGENTAVGIGVRKLNPKFRVVVTATPIKNRLSDFFQLAVWVAGGQENAHMGWPFAEDAVNEFNALYGVTERNLTRNRSNRRIIAKVGNLQKLWTIITPLVIRRRKQEAVKDLVKKTRNEVYVPLGEEQAKVYRNHLKANYLIESGPRMGMPSGGKKLMKLRQVAVCPESENLGDGDWRSKYSFTPKVSMALSLTEQILSLNEQVIIFSPFIESLDTIASYLSQAGVRFVKLDGRESGYDRSVKAAEFKKGNTVPVMLASTGCVSYGYSFSRCNNIITLGFEWAMDLLIQAINRGHRCDSVKDVNVYMLITKGTVDVRMLSMFKDKEESSDVVLDAESGSESSVEVEDDDNIWNVLRSAESDFNSENENPISESSLLVEWPSMSKKLNDSMKKWNPVF